MCDKCDRYIRSIAIASLKSYQEILALIDEAMVDDALELIDGPLPDRKKPLTGKSTYSCMHCSQLFLLEIGGGHVLGDQWRPLHGN